MLIYGQFGIIQNLQISPIPQTSFLVETLFVVYYSKLALGSDVGTGKMPDQLKKTIPTRGADSTHP